MKVQRRNRSASRVVWNLARVGSEAAERSEAHGSPSVFTVVRFTWLAAIGVLVAFSTAVLTGRLADSVELQFGLSSAPMAIVPVVAVGINLVAADISRTVTTSKRLLLGSPLVISSVVWLTIIRGGASR